MSQAPPLKEALLTLETILNRKKASGIDTIPLSENSLATLQNLPFALMQASRAVINTPKPAPQTPEAPPKERPQEMAPVSPPPQSPPPSVAVEHPPTQNFDHPYGELAQRVEKRNQVEIIHPIGNSLRDRLNNLFRIAKKDIVLKNTLTLRDQLVFATGTPESDVLFVGEAPGEEEENQKKPFVGPAGQKLDGIIKAMGLSRDTVYISNIVKYRPKIGDGRFQGSKNRKPTPEEMALSVKFVRSEIEIIQPKVIVALGGTAAEGLLEIGGSVTAMRGKSYDLGGIPVVVTYHPSYLLRVEAEPDKQRSLQEKRKVWEDMLRVMEILNLPISDAQRNFFTK